MRTFIIFLAFLLIFTSFTVYAADMNDYMQLQAELKAVAEECAGGGALQLAPESFDEGRVIISQRDAQLYAEKVLAETFISSPPLKHGSLSASAVLLSDESIEVTVTYTADEGYDLFRLPFLSKKTAARRAAYRWE